ncbi:MAG: putative sugar O-methyltransferase [Planctomycetes bacterium]|nr:putative sugar O-methyltransferase [Planctomycetota bacterium]
MKREFFGPRDNFPISANDFAAACRLCDTMVEMRAQRAAYLQQNELDPKVYLPAQMWSGDFVASNFRKIARKDYHTINHLRCLTYNFTGFSMLMMAPCENTPEVMEVPADADAIIRGVAGLAANAAVEFVRATQNTPQDRIVDTPRMFGESGWDVDGTIVNFDTWSNQQRINGLHGSGVLDWLLRRRAERGRIRIVEIGAGFGNLAYSLHRILGPIDYHIVDLPESMIYSSIWLETVLGARCTVAAAGRPLESTRPGVTFIGNHMLEEFLPQIGEVDLVINVMSLSEMSPVQVAYYADCARELIGESGLFHEQNYILPGIHTDVVQILGQHFDYGCEIDETAAPHRGRSVARQWANRYRAELWNGGGNRPLPSFSGASPQRHRATARTPAGRAVLQG